MASNAVEVYVKLPTGRSAKYDILPSQCLSALCELVAKEEKVDANHVRLKYQGKVLQKSKSVKEYGVRVETILKAEFIVPKAIDFSLQLPDGDMDGIECFNLDPVSSLFDCVAEKIGVTQSRIELKCGSKSLKSSTVSILDTGIEPGSTIVASVKAAEKKLMKSVKPVEEMREEDKDAILTSFNADGKRVDVVFSFDTTGSMYSYLTEVRTKLRTCCTRLLEDIPGIRIGLIAHGDYCDEGQPYVLRSADLTDSIDSLLTFARDVPSTSGGDSPECYEWVLHKAQTMDWSEDSAKALVVIGDLYPHPPSYTDQSIKWQDELNILKGMGVKVYGVQAGMNHDATEFYAEISEATEGKHLRLQHFDIITDMFLAVCYREGNEELLEEFEQELESAGNMTEAKKEMFSMLKETTKAKQSKQESSKRYVSSGWWDHSLDKATTPQYLYDAETNTWKGNTVCLHSGSSWTTKSKSSKSECSKSKSSRSECSRSKSSRSKRNVKIACSLM